MEGGQSSLGFLGHHLGQQVGFHRLLHAAIASQCFQTVPTGSRQRKQYATRNQEKEFN